VRREAYTSEVKSPRRCILEVTYMRYRSMLTLATAGLAATVALTAFAIFATGTTDTAHAETHGIQNLQCSVAPSPVTLNTPEVLSCTFTFHGTPHTFVADFEIVPTVPHLQVSSCTLDGTIPVHIGPCP
jgi:hypothetical protein